MVKSCLPDAWRPSVRSRQDFGMNSTPSSLPVEVCGHRGGCPVIYMHGVPGSSSEAAMIDAQARAAKVELLTIDRSRVVSGVTGEAYLTALADLIRDLGKSGKLPILGFSIGAALALRVAARLGSDAGPLFLISAAGPLDVSGAFADMGDGARVFRMAKARSLGFDLLVRCQSVLARNAPGALSRLLFAGAGGEEKAFAVEARQQLARVYTEAWSNAGLSYRRDIAAYVENWSLELGRVQAPVRLWHGTADTWAPISMAHMIVSRLPLQSQLSTGTAGHYTTLLSAAKEVLVSAQMASCSA